MNALLTIKANALWNGVAFPPFSLLGVRLGARLGRDGAGPGLSLPGTVLSACLCCCRAHRSYKEPKPARDRRRRPGCTVLHKIKALERKQEEKENMRRWNQSPCWPSSLDFLNSNVVSKYKMTIRQNCRKKRPHNAPLFWQRPTPQYPVSPI